MTAKNLELHSILDDALLQRNYESLLGLKHTPIEPSTIAEILRQWLKKGSNDCPIEANLCCLATLYGAIQGGWLKFQNFDELLYETVEFMGFQASEYPFAKANDEVRYMTQLLLKLIYSEQLSAMPREDSQDQVAKTSARIRVLFEENSPSPGGFYSKRQLALDN